MSGALSRALWGAGWPVRAILIGLIRMYQVTLSGVLGGQCRFHPTCSVYAEQGIRQVGAFRGLGLATWRVLRCSPLSKGGIDHPPEGRHGDPYDAAIPEEPAEGVAA